MDDIILYLTKPERSTFAVIATMARKITLINTFFKHTFEKLCRFCFVLEQTMQNREERDTEDPPVITSTQLAEEPKTSAQTTGVYPARGLTQPESAVSSTASQKICNVTSKCFASPIANSANSINVFIKVTSLYFYILYFLYQLSSNLTK